MHCEGQPSLVRKLNLSIKWFLNTKIKNIVTIFIGLHYKPASFNYEWTEYIYF